MTKKLSIFFLVFIFTVSITGCEKKSQQVGTKVPEGKVEQPVKKSVEESIEKAVVKNQAPKAEAGPEKSARAGEVLQFDGSASYDPDGRITVYSWEFGDNGMAEGIKVQHPYSKTGTFQVVLMVVDDKGAQSTDTTRVIVSDRESVDEPTTISPEDLDQDLVNENEFYDYMKDIIAQAKAGVGTTYEFVWDFKENDLIKELKVEELGGNMFVSTAGIGKDEVVSTGFKGYASARCTSKTYCTVRTTKARMSGSVLVNPEPEPEPEPEVEEEVASEPEPEPEETLVEADLPVISGGDLYANIQTVDNLAKKYLGTCLYFIHKSKEGEVINNSRISEITGLSQQSILFRCIAAEKDQKCWENYTTVKDLTLYVGVNCDKSESCWVSFYDVKIPECTLLSPEEEQGWAKVPVTENFSTPEKAFDTYVRAINNKDIELYKRCLTSELAAMFGETVDASAWLPKSAYDKADYYVAEQTENQAIMRPNNEEQQTFRNLGPYPAYFFKPKLEVLTKETGLWKMDILATIERLTQDLE